MKMKLTAKAAKYLSDGLVRVPRTDDQDVCFRVVDSSETGRFKITIDRPMPGDQTFEVEGTVVLTMAPDIATLCEDKVLDLRERPDGKRQLAFT